MQDLKPWIEIEEFHYQKDEIITQHSSLWGDFNFSLNGLLEFSIGAQKFLSPPNYGIWIPPHTAHCSTAIDAHSTHYICIRIHPQLCQQLSSTCKTLSIQPFFRHTVAELLRLKSSTPNPAIPARSNSLSTQDLTESIHIDYQHNLLSVLFNQIQQAPADDQYLPQTHHPSLHPILKQLAEPRRFKQSLQQILADFEVSERHILRLSQQQLQLPISEWRNRAKIIYAISELRQGRTIKQIGYDLGYQHSSSFIDFFKRYTGQTPAQMRDA